MGSFGECKKVFGKREEVPLSEVKPLLISLGADESELTEQEIDRIVATANLDGDDNIDFKEFLIAAAIGCFLKEENEANGDEKFAKIRKGFLVAKEAFAFIDEDGSGEIDFKELDFDGDKNIEFSEFVWGITAWVGMDDDEEL